MYIGKGRRMSVSKYILQLVLITIKNLTFSDKRGNVDPHRQDGVRVRMYVNGHSEFHVVRLVVVNPRGVHRLHQGRHLRVRHVNRES